MSDQGEELHQEEDLYEGAHEHSLLELFEELSPLQKFRKMMYGLKQPKETGDYKWAAFQVQRLAAPIMAVVVPVLIIMFLAVFAVAKKTAPRLVEVQVLEPEEAPDLEEPEDMEEPPEPPEPIDMDFTPDVVVPDIPTPTLAPPTDFSPVPADFDAVAMVKSPVVMRGIYGARTGAARGTAMKQYGAPAGVEGAVLRALRWLKKNQNEEGSWNKSKEAMTGMCILAFLAHGETPASPEFGETVEKAIRWLVSRQNSGTGRISSSYSHAIATYALCEAYGLTKVPSVKYAAEKAIDVLIKGQNKNGGWCYGLVYEDPSDTSVMGWCAQALKAAYMAGLTNEGLKGAMDQAIVGFQKNSSPSGGFGYRGPGRGGLTGVGVLCMQLLGAAREVECRNGLIALDDVTFFWDPENEQTKWNNNYYWYYITQAKFHHGGDTWNNWNRLFAPVLVKEQTIIKQDIEGPDGKMKDTGWWDMEAAITGHSDGPVMNTALACLQLEVYYRYLPTFKKPEANDDSGPAVSSDDDVDIDISI